MVKPRKLQLFGSGRSESNEAGVITRVRPRKDDGLNPATMQGSGLAGPAPFERWRYGIWTKAEASWQSKVAKPNPPMHQLPPTPYLDHPRPRKSGDKFVGGTLIAAGIVTPEQHAAELAKPNHERPKQCAACMCPRVHIHERRTRLLDGLGSATVDILIFRCASKDCRVIWRVLPAFLARYLWRAWARIVEALDPARERSSTPNRTRRRWLRRLRERATMLVVTLAQLGPARPPGVVILGISATRREVIRAFGLEKLAELAALVDHHTPGVRVM